MTETERPSGGVTRFWAELKQRKVTRVAVTYAVMSWLIIQIADTTFSGFGIPDWAFRFVVISLAFFFPVAVLLAWAFELTPEGIKTTRRSRQQARSESETVSQLKGNNRLALVFAAGLPTLIFGALALAFYLRSEPATEPSVQAPVEVAAEASIAVLPLINMSPNPDNAFFAGGVHEDILTNLSRVPDLDVVSRTTAMKYVNSDLSVAEIGRELGVQYIVEGSVRRVENHVRVTVQLIDSQRDKHLWANNYDRELVDVFATQSAISREITQSIHFEIRPESFSGMDDMPTHSVKAYDLFTKARSRDRGEPESEQSLMAIRALLEEAVAEDPDFVEAWGLLNETYDHAIRNVLINEWFGQNPEAREAFIQELAPRAKLALDKAVALDPDNIETLLAQASDYYAEEFVEGFQQERRQYIDRALELYPDNGMAWYVLAYWYRIEEQSREADTAFRKALELDPMNARILHGSTWHFDQMSDVAMIELINSRLDASLGTARPHVKLLNLRNAFLASADESLIMEMLLLLDREKSNFEHSNQEFFWRQQLYILAGDLQAVAEMEQPSEPPNDADVWIWSYFVADLGGKMNALTRTGQTDDALETARIILRRSDLARQLPWIDKTLVGAQLVNGDIEQARELAEFMVDAISVDYDMYGRYTFPALSLVDNDQAARLMLETIETHHATMASDNFAALCAAYPELMSHPDVVAYYVEEGKWVNFLARCTPEYREFAKQ